MVTRWRKALIYSWQGLALAYRSEHAFKEECLALIVLLPTAWWLAESSWQLALLCASLLLVLIVELLNSALEALCDHLWRGYDLRAQQIKDYGSAAVWLSLLLAACVWLGALLDS